MGKRVLVDKEKGIMGKKILITGYNGFVGSHLAEYCLAQNANNEVFGMVRSHRSNMQNVRHLDGKVQVVVCEMLDAGNVFAVVKKYQPDLIFHLAAQSFVQSSWDAPSDTLTNNIIGQVNLLEAVRRVQGADAKYSPRIHVAGSSEEYGKPEEVPMAESHDLKPLSPYGVSKVAQDKLACQYVASYGMRIVVTRAFNHTGPRRGDMFVTSSFCKQVAAATDGDVIRVGNLDAVRDFTDVRDMVRAYYMLLNSEWSSIEPRYGNPFNICSGVGIEISELLDLVIKISGKKIAIKVDPARLRPSDIPELIGDSTKFRAATGWKPEIPFKQTILDLYTYHLVKIN